jgi:aspartate/methionine/tyrosine aminotransferase
LKTPSTLLSAQETTIFTVMSALAAKHGAINLGQGFPDTEGPAAIIEVARDALADGRNQYAPLTGLPELRQAVAAANRRFYGLDIDPDREVVVTSGATEALFVSLAAILNPGDEVVVIEPLYDTYLPAIRMLGAIPRPVRLRPPDWSLPEAELAAAFGPRTKAILFNSPMNPTGKVFTGAELDLIAGLVLRHDAYAVCDEVYEHLIFDGLRHTPLMTRPGMRDRCLRIGSAGKTFSLTGWKVGYLTAAAPLATLAARAHQTTVFATAPNLQRAIAFGLGLDDAYFNRLATTLQSKRDRLARGLTALGLDVLPCRGSYFLTVDIGGADDAAWCRDLTERAGVTAIPVSAFYAADPPRHLVRFAFCKRDHVLDEAIDRLRAFFARGAGAVAPIDAPALNH